MIRLTCGDINYVKHQNVSKYYDHDCSRIPDFQGKTEKSDFDY